MADRTCSWDRCADLVYGRGLCRRHYGVARRAGTLASYPVVRLAGRPLVDRLMARLLPRPSGCWELTGSLNGDGYSRIWFEGRLVGGHRAMWQCMRGPIPEGLELDHLCRNRACVNPDHLEPVTRGENARRGIAGEHYASRTHCKWGHEYTPENTRIRPTHRVCIACERDRGAARRARKRAER